MELADKSVTRISEIVVDMLDVSRLEKGEIGLDISANDVELCELVVDEIALMQSRFDGRKITLINKTDSDVRARIDIVKYREVVNNLLSNALQYSPADTNVDVIIQYRNDKFFLSVKDRGIGMSKKDSKKLFTRFFRADQAKLMRPNGTGIGLFVVKRIIESHGGEIGIETAKGRGSTFTAWIPTTSTSE